MEKKLLSWLRQKMFDKIELTFSELKIFAK